MIICSRCHKPKPETDYYTDPSRTNGRASRCIDCDNGRKRQTPARVLRTRARQRATAALVAEHPERFRELLDHFGEIVRQENEIIRGQPEANLASGGGDLASGPVRLRPGRYRQGEDAVDRIDTARGERCEQCRDHHARGHACHDCGASPADQRTGTERLDREAFLEDVEYLLDSGETLAPTIAKRIGTTVEAMCRRLHRYDRSDLIVRMDATGRPTAGAA